jgi:hypothetical protein
MRLCLAAAVVCMSIVGVALADDVHTRRLTNIPAQGLAPALQHLAKERNLQIVYVSEEIGERHTQGAVGELDPEQALGLLLKGTGLTFEHLDDETIAIVPATSAASRSSTDESTAPGATGTQPRSTTAQTVQSEAVLTPAEPVQVTIEARRQALEYRVLHFVTALTAGLSFHQSVANWYGKICPQVSGLPQAQSEFGRCLRDPSAVIQPHAHQCISHSQTV